MFLNLNYIIVPVCVLPYYNANWKFQGCSNHDGVAKKSFCGSFSI